MRKILIGFAALATATPAVACMCLEPTTAQQKREFAAKIAAAADAVVDVEQIAPMDPSALRGETYRVVSIHYGRAPGQFELDRRLSRGGDGSVISMRTSCDVVPEPGKRTTVVLYRARTPDRFSLGGTCEHLFVNSPGAIDLIREEARRLAQSAERA